MSATELQKTINRLTPQQNRTVARYIGYLVADDSPKTLSRRRRITRITKEMDAGQTVTLAEIRGQREAR